MPIDVLLPYYGDVEMMKTAVRSVLDQRHEQWRLIVVDDGYPDPEPERWFSAMDDQRVTYLRNAENLGANNNYRKCLELATAPLMIIMGADDVMLPDHLGVVTEIFDQHPAAAIVQTGVRVIDEHGQPVKPLVDRMKAFYAPPGPQQTVLTGEPLAVSLLRGNWTYFPSIAWRTDLVRSVGFRTGLDVVQDLALLLDLAVDGGVLVFDPAVTFQYRRHSASDSSVRALSGERFDEERAFFDRQAVALTAKGWSKAARVAHWHLSSRLSALVTLPRAARIVGWQAVPRLARHVVRW